MIKDKGFHFVYPTDEDIQRENEKIAFELKEEQKTEFVFNGEHLYELGRGHEFLNGFFTEYITKSAKKAWRYDSGKWNILGDSYDYEDGNFVLIPRPEIKNEPIDWNEVVFPMVKNLSGPIADKLPSVQPLIKPKNKN